MKIKFPVSEKHNAEIEKELAAHGIEVDEDACRVLPEANSCADCALGKRGERICRIHTDEIIYTESFAHNIIAHAVNGAYRLRERLWQLGTPSRSADVLTHQRFRDYRRR